jgi:hypothetical protein
VDVIWTAVGQCLRLLRLLTPGDWCSARGRVDLARCRGGARRGGGTGSHRVDAVRRAGRAEIWRPAPGSSGEGSAGDDDAHLHTDLRSASRNLQVTHELVSDIYVSFAISDFADVHSAFHWPLGDGTP